MAGHVWQFVLAFVSGLSLACPAEAKTGFKTIDIKFAQKFGKTVCGDAVPSDYYCLHVTGIATTQGSQGGHFDRVVAFDITKFDEKHPTCLPDETSGALYLQEGTLTFRAPGAVCLIDGTASYALVVTGGTGQYKGAQGGGQITVPPPVNDTSGTELWHIQLF